MCIYIYIWWEMSDYFLWIKWNLTLSPHFDRRTRNSILMILGEFLSLLRVTYKLSGPTFLWWPPIPIWSTFAWAISCFTLLSLVEIFAETRLSLWEIPLRSWILLEGGLGNWSPGSYCFWNAKSMSSCLSWGLSISSTFSLSTNHSTSSRSRSRFCFVF